MSATSPTGPSAPGSSTPDSSTPDSSTPGSSTPDSSTPDSSTPGSSISDPAKAAPPEAWAPLVRVAQLAGRPIERFLRVEASSGLVLLAATAVALILANSPWAEGYRSLWQTPLGLRVGGFEFERTLSWFVNDALMVIFFFVVGLEIRGELHHGELSDRRRAVLPVAAALGGMLAPAILYLCLAGAKETHSGWGVPMATDIAFAVGILNLLGKRVPASLRILLLALAVIDDLGAIVVIALFYSSGVAAEGFAVAALGLVLVFVMQRLAVRSKLAYVLPGFIVWAGIYAAGVHPTIAGVIVGLVTPVRAWHGPEGFRMGLRGALERLEDAPPESLSTRELTKTLRRVNVVRREALSPAESLIETLHPWVAYGVMPVFALANAGVTLSGISLDASSTSVAWGVGIGLVLGKPLGILLVIWLAVKLRLGALPSGLGLRHLAVLGIAAGIGFTMALFIAQLAFSDETLLGAAKLGVLAGSTVAALLALGLGRAVLHARAQQPGPAP